MPHTASTPRHPVTPRAEPSGEPASPSLPLPFSRAHALALAAQACEHRGDTRGADARKAEARALLGRLRTAAGVTHLDLTMDQRVVPFDVAQPEFDDLERRRRQFPRTRPNTDYKVLPTWGGEQGAVQSDPQEQDPPRAVPIDEAEQQESQGVSDPSVRPQPQGTGNYYAPGQMHPGAVPGPAYVDPESGNRSPSMNGNLDDFEWDQRHVAEDSPEAYKNYTGF